MNFLPDRAGSGPLEQAALRRAYKCRCNNAVFFLNSECLKCSTPLGYECDLGRIVSLVPGPGFGLWQLIEPGIHPGLYRRCANLNTPAGCNWLIPADYSSHVYCRACRLNRTVPNLSSPQDAIFWGRIEAAKRRVLSAVVALGLPLASRINEDRYSGLAFDFLRSVENAAPVLTGHKDGLITLNIEEADDAKREQIRSSLHEPYRTLVGHFRHEIGHYYWYRLVGNSHWLHGFRRLFGDERIDYCQAIRANYQGGPKPGWPQNHVSAYASAHPWEDWAETFAHYMHMVDTLGTATSFGLDTNAIALPFEPFGTDALYSFESEESLCFLSLVNSWLKLTAVMNELCRSMGQCDFYPFVLPSAVVTKLHFVHLLVCASNGKGHEATKRFPSEVSRTEGGMYGSRGRH